jgi:thiamine pyrophosphate-dependent acetolactate synthase large subunit-like protein
VVAVVGDGGFAMAGLEVASLVRHAARVSVIVLVDRAYGMIRHQQHAAFGRAVGTTLPKIDYAAFARSLGVRYLRYDGDQTELERVVVAGPTLVEVGLRASWSTTYSHSAGTLRAMLRGLARLTRLRP